MFSSALLLLIFAFISHCFTQSIKSTLDPKIVNGKIVRSSEIPYQVSLQLWKYAESHFCGGSIISMFYVVTAAHCVENLGYEDIRVVAGTDYLDEPRYTRTIQEIIMHEEYAPGDSYHNDIALIRLFVPLMPSTIIGYAKLPKQNETFEEGRTAIVSGYGKLSEHGPISRHLLKATISIASQEYCNLMYQKIHSNVYASHICANNPGRLTGACNGDSGGPLTVDGKLVGIVSWSLGCSLTKFPTVFTRISSYINWIEMQIFSRREI